MATYLIAKANQTARVFVVRAENARGKGWIILDESNSYTKACALRDTLNKGGR